MRTLKVLFHVFLRRLAQAQTTARRSGFARVSALTFCALAFASSMPLTANAHGGEDHEAKKTEAITTKSSGTATKSSGATLVRTADRNVQTPDGQFRVHLRQSPADPRTGEEVQFAVDPSEQVEGGFGGGGTVPLEGAKINARVTTAAGQVVENNLPTHAEESGSYSVHYTFKSGGEYKIIFDVRTSDNRQFDADFPLSIVAAPVNWIFWLGLAVLLLLSAGTIFGYYNSWLGDGANLQTAARQTLPLAAGVLLFFAIGVTTLAYFMPPREQRKVAGLPTTGGVAQATEATTASGDPALGGSGAVLNISKESQLLFGIRTLPVELRQITSGLKVTGTVKTRPDAHAVVSPPVSGRIFLKQGINIGTVVGRGEQVGTVEQILGAPEQASLEGQRIGLRTAALEQQAKQAQQTALAQQTRTRLTQAQRELRRAANLVPCQVSL